MRLVGDFDVLKRRRRRLLRLLSISGTQRHSGSPRAWTHPMTVAIILPAADKAQIAEALPLVEEALWAERARLL